MGMPHAIHYHMQHCLWLPSCLACDINPFLTPNPKKTTSHFTSTTHKQTCSNIQVSNRRREKTVTGKLVPKAVKKCLVRGSEWLGPVLTQGPCLWRHRRGGEGSRVRACLLCLHTSWRWGCTVADTWGMARSCWPYHSTHWPLPLQMQRSEN